MRDVNTYLERADEALRLLQAADRGETQAAILEIARTWVGLAEERAAQFGLGGPELGERLAALRSHMARAEGTSEPPGA